MSEPGELDWPYGDYVPPEFALRSSFDYLSRRPFDTRLLGRLQQAFESKDLEVLTASLAEARETIEGAIEVSELDANEAWLKHEAWLPTLGFSYVPVEEPARLLLESIDRVGAIGDNHAPQRVWAAVALWCYGEHCHAGSMRMLEQTALALAEAEYYRGIASVTRLESARLSERNRAAAEKRHQTNRQRKLKGFDIWTSRAWNIQADAEREIAKECFVIQPVAGRWIREFKQSEPAYRALQRKDDAAQET